ncbi:MAG: Cleavage polyadenylation factor subunit clp1 [Marteilia pararefringens]
MSDGRKMSRKTPIANFSLNKNQSDSNDQKCVTFNLQKLQELRIEFGPYLEKNNPHVIELVDGTCEIFGFELIKNSKYKINMNEKLFLFSWTGCTVNVFGEIQFNYISSTTQMVYYLNLHQAFQQIRKNNKIAGLRGPRILVCGSLDCGKTSLCKILCNYCVRSGEKLILADFDRKSGIIGLPNSIGCALIDKPIDIECELLCDSSFLSPLVYLSPTSINQSHSSSSSNNLMKSQGKLKNEEISDLKLFEAPDSNFEELENKIINNLSEAINMKFENDEKLNQSGIVVDTSAIVSYEDIRNISNIIKLIEIDHVIVIESERIEKQIKFELSKSHSELPKIIKVPKSSGVIERSTKEHLDLINLRIHRYFYGPTNSWLPYEIKVKMSEINLFQLISKKIDKSLLPLGVVLENEILIELEKLYISESLSNNIFATCFLISEKSYENPNNQRDHGEDNSKPSIQSLFLTNISGYVLLKEIDMKYKTVTILSTIGPSLVFNNLIFLSCKFFELVG